MGETTAMPEQEQPPEVSMPLSAAAALRAGLGRLRHVPFTGSTNEDLADEARRGLTDPCVLVAGYQTAGRGRMGRRWRDVGATAGESHCSLLVSLRLPGPTADAADRVSAVSAAALAAVASVGLPTAADLAEVRPRAGVATTRSTAMDPLCRPSEALRVPTTRSAVADTSARGRMTTGGPRADSEDRPEALVLSKWPNDLVVEFSSAVGGRRYHRRSGKLAGVLAEAVDGPDPVVIVGLGVNLSPVRDEPEAISLSEVGVGASRDELLSRMLEILPVYSADPALGRAALVSASATVGRRVRVEQADGTVITGTARTIDDRGRLIVDTATGSRWLQEGDVRHLRPAEHPDERDEWGDEHDLPERG